MRVILFGNSFSLLLEALFVMGFIPFKHSAKVIFPFNSLIFNILSTSK